MRGELGQKYLPRHGAASLTGSDIDLVILTGPAGCGKTLLAMAAALEMVVERGLYDKVIVTRNTPRLQSRLVSYRAPKRRKWRLG